MGQASPFTFRHLKLDKAKHMKNAVEKISATEITLKTPVQRQHVLSGPANPKVGHVSFSPTCQSPAIHQPLHPRTRSIFAAPSWEPRAHDSPLGIARKPWTNESEWRNTVTITIKNTGPLCLLLAMLPAAPQWPGKTLFPLKSCVSRTGTERVGGLCP